MITHILLSLLQLPTSSSHVGEDMDADYMEGEDMDDEHLDSEILDGNDYTKNRDDNVEMDDHDDSADVDGNNGGTNDGSNNMVNMVI